MCLLQCATTTQDRENQNGHQNGKMESPASIVARRVITLIMRLGK